MFSSYHAGLRIYGTCDITHTVWTDPNFIQPNLSESACLKNCKQELELMTDRQIPDKTKTMMRGGLSSVFNLRQEVANNTMLPKFDESKVVSSII